MPSPYASLLLPLLASSSASAFVATTGTAGGRFVVSVGGGRPPSTSSSSSTTTAAAIVSPFFGGVVVVPAASSSSSSSSSLAMAIDYNDPGVMEEFAVIQLMEYDEVVAELAQSGVRAPADMGDMDVKLMLVELRTVMKGGSGSSGSGSSSGSSNNDTPPTKFGSRFEELLWTKPVFRDMYEILKSTGDHNRMNVAAEYCNEPDGARSRYSSSYGTFLDEVEAALNARAEIKTSRVRFGGFPANMGEYGLKMTLEALGGIEDMIVQVSDDGITLVGEVQFESVEVAKVAIEQYDGMDMGMGDTLKMVSI